MIAFNEDCGPESFTRGDLEQILSDLLANNEKPYEAGVTHKGLSPTQIQDIIAFLMFHEENASVQFTVSNEPDGYHLTLSIDKKQKKP